MDRLDIIIFGATGFTGKYTIPPVEKLTKSSGKEMTWGVAGRSESKLNETLVEMSKKINIDLSHIPIIVADVADEDSLKKMTARARIIINTCGPYRFYGEPVIKACVETSTHHVDVSGEPQYIERMQLIYHKEAIEKGIYIISACGFDSIPADMGINFIQHKFEGTLNSVETYLESHEVGERRPGASINYGTWESAVYGLAHYDELKTLRKKLFPERLPEFTPKLKSRGSIHKAEVTKRWAVPFLGSDRSVVLRSQRHFFEVDKLRPIQVQTYLTVPSILALILFVIFGGMFALLTKFEMGRKLLLNYPGFFSGGFISREGPSEEKMKNTKFSVTIVGEGWSEKLSNATDQFTTAPNKRMIAKVSGTNPGYGATTVALTLAALTVLLENSKMPNKGGVYAPAAAFSNTSLIEKLNENELKFEILSVSDKVSSNL